MFHLFLFQDGQDGYLSILRHLCAFGCGFVTKLRAANGGVVLAIARVQRFSLDVLRYVVQLGRVGGLFVLGFLYDQLEGRGGVLRDVERGCVDRAAAARCGLFIQRGNARACQANDLIGGAACDIGLAFFDVRYAIDRFRFCDQRLLRLFFRYTADSYRARRLLFDRERVRVRFASFARNDRQLYCQEARRAAGAVQRYARRSV